MLIAIVVQLLREQFNPEIETNWMSSNSTIGPSDFGDKRSGRRFHDNVNPLRCQ